MRRRNLVAAACLLPLARLGVMHCRYSRVRRVAAALCPLRHQGPPAEEALSAAQCLRHDVAVAAIRGRSGATCLPQALVTWALLRRRGIDSEICLGARVVDTKFEAHAWVEVGGLSLEAPRGPADSPTLAFAPLRRFA